MITHFAIVILLIQSSVQAAKKAVNVPEYKSLCRILQLAGQLTSSQGISDYVEQAVAWKEFDTLVGQLETFSNATGTDGTGKLKLGDGSTEIQLIETRLRQRVHRILEYMVGEGKVITATATALKTQAENRVKAAAKDLARAVGGTAGIDSEGRLLPGLSANPLGFAPAEAASSRKGTCGDQSSAYGGKNLVTDLICICASQADGSNEAACGFKASGSNKIWSDASKLDSDKGDVWQTIYTQCTVKDKLSTRPTPEGISEAMETFEALIGRGAKALTDGTTARQFFGEIDVSGKDCSGVQGTDGPCVKYEVERTGEFKIPWLDKVKSAQAELRGADRLNQQAQKQLDKLERLREDATRALVEANISQSLVEREKEGLPNSSAKGSGVQPAQNAVVSTSEPKSDTKAKGSLKVSTMAVSLLSLFS